MVSIEVPIIILIIGIISFFIWRWIFSKMKIKRKNLVSIIVSIISAPLIYTAIVAIWLMSLLYYPNRDFDRNQWFENKEKRYEYTYSLKKSKILEGKTKDEIEQILGEPNYEEKEAIVYYIGFKPQLGVDPDWLKIRFKNGIVYEITEYNS